MSIYNVYEIYFICLYDVYISHLVGVYPKQNKKSKNRLGNRCCKKHIYPELGTILLDIAPNSGHICGNIYDIAPSSGHICEIYMNLPRNWGQFCIYFFAFTYMPLAMVDNLVKFSG